MVRRKGIVCGLEKPFIERLMRAGAIVHWSTGARGFGAKLGYRVQSLYRGLRCMTNGPNHFCMVESALIRRLNFGGKNK